MNIDEIRKSKPEGATHYEIEDDEVYYYARDYMGRWCGDDGCGNWWPLRISTYEELDRTLKPL